MPGRQLELGFLFRRLLGANGVTKCASKETG